MNSQFRKGLLHGIPIALGYLSVSFGFGIMAVQKGLSVFSAVMIYVCVERINEIRKGEEDDISKY